MDSKKLNLGRVVAVWLIAAVGVILSIYLFVNIAPDAVDNPTAAQLESQAGAVSLVVEFTTILVYLVLGLIVIFLAINIITNFHKQKKSLITAAIMLVLVGVFYMVGQDNEVPKALADKGATEGDAILASVGISLTGFLIAIAILLALFMGFITKYLIKR